MLEAIGGLTLVFGGAWLFISFMQGQEEENEEKEQLIQESWTCRFLMRDYKKSLEEGKPIMTEKELKKKLREIISRPEELAEIKKSRDAKQKREEEWELERKRNRIFGYKHENQIFKIFSTSRELSKEHLLLGIMKEYNVSGNDSIEIFNSWIEHRLIDKCIWNKEKYEITRTLDSENENLDENDLTRKKWLENKGLVLDARSPEYNQWMNQFPEL